MPALAKQPSKPVAKPRAKAPAKPRSLPSEPFLRFYHSKSLRAKTVSVIAALEKAKDTTEHRRALSDVVAELTSSGMDYFFLRPLKIAKVGFFTAQSANVGMAATTSMLGSVIRNIIGGMDKPQLLSVCSSIRQLME